MRRNTQSNFFRTNEVQSNEYDMFRLKITNPNGFSNQTVVGFFENGSNDLDAIDTKGFGATPLYSILGQDKLVIQARALPFEQSTVIPIGFQGGNAGTHTITLNEASGIFQTNQFVLLHDLLLGIYHNLSNAPYEFEATTGANDNRFEIVFSEILNNETPELQNTQLIAFANENEIHIQLKGNENMQKVTLFDLSGRLIYEEKNIDAKQFIVQKLTPTETVLMVKITDINGKIFITKLFY